MTERGYFFDGRTTGDSSVAPYDDSEVALPYRFYGDFVIPEYANELLVESNTPFTGGIKLNTGAAMVQGALYENTTLFGISIPSTAANNRIDLIVLRYTSGATQTVRLTRIAGAEAVNPAPPALGATDFLLAWVYVPSTYVAATDVFLAAWVHDERLFKQIGTIATSYHSENIMPNSEFLAYSGGASGTLPPDYWKLDGVPTTAIGNFALSHFGNQVRGQEVRIQSNAGAGMQTYVRIGDISEIFKDCNNMITVKGLLYITAGSVRIDVVNEDYVGGTYGSQSIYFQRTGIAQEFIIRVPLDTTATKPLIRIRVLANSANSDFYVGQIIMVRGYVPGNFRPKHETLYFDYDVLDASWNATAKSTAVTTINAVTSFGAVIPPYFRALIVKLRARDSGSAAGAPSVKLYHTSASSTNATLYLSLTGFTNDVWREAVGYVANSPANANAPFKASVTATGALTCDVTIQPIGIIT